MTIQLDTAAKQLLSTFQHRNGAIGAQAQAAVAQACEAKGAPLSAAELQKALQAALPSQSAQITEASKSCSTSRYHSDGKNGDFLTQFLKLRIEKDRAEVWSQPATRRTARDPLMAEFIMDKDAQVVLLFNARDVDEKGRPLLMKAVCREGATLEGIDLTHYRTKWAEAGSEDIQTVPKNASFVAVQDTQESEFEFGDPVIQVSLGKKGEELSRGVAVRPENQETVRYYPSMWQMQPNGQNAVVPNTAMSENRAATVTSGAQLDRTPVKTFDEKIKLGLKVKDSFPEGGWLETKIEHIDAKMFIEPGLMFEPDTQAEVRLINSTLTTKVQADDAFLVGAPAAEAEIALTPYAAQNISWLLQQPVTRTSQSLGGSQDAETKQWKLADLVFADKAKIGVGAGTLVPQQDLRLKSAQLEEMKISGGYSQIDGSDKGQHLCLTLGEGFLSAKDGASVKGWSIVAGYTDESGQWQQCAARTVKGKTGSGCETFEFDLADAPALYKANRDVEIRLFNAEGVPAQRVRVPVKELPWI